MITCEHCGEPPIPNPRGLRLCYDHYYGYLPVAEKDMDPKQFKQEYEARWPTKEEEAGRKIMEQRIQDQIDSLHEFVKIVMKTLDDIIDKYEDNPLKHEDLEEVLKRVKVSSKEKYRCPVDGYDIVYDSFKRKVTYSFDNARGQVMLDEVSREQVDYYLRSGYWEK